MHLFGPHEHIGVQVMLLTDSGRRLYDIPDVEHFQIDATYDNYGVDRLTFSMLPLMDSKGVSFTIYDEEKMREDFEQRIRTERSEVQHAVRELERGH